MTFLCNTTAYCGCSSEPAVISTEDESEIVKSSSWEWMVSIVLNNSHLCDGVLIHAAWVLTAADCLGSFNASDIVVIGGKNGTSSTQQRINASRIYKYTQKDSETSTKNMALIRLSKSFNPIDRSIRIICIANVTEINYPPNQVPVSQMFNPNMFHVVIQCFSFALTSVSGGQIG